MRLALIGLGKATSHQLAAIARTHGVRLVDAFVLPPEKCGGLGGKVRCHQTLEALIQNSDADIFVISNHALSPDFSKTLLENGRAVLIDQPASVNCKELDTLAALATGRKIFVYLAMHAALGPEVRWWLEERNEAKFHLGELVRFESGCFDPYFVHGKMDPQAGSFRGSWFEGGIEALGVIGSFIDGKKIKVNESTLARVPDHDNRDVRGKASFYFPNSNGQGYGHIETNWTLCLDRKVTRLSYEGGDIILHHSKEAVFLCRNGNYTLLKDLRNRFPRQTNHYCSLFADVRNRLKSVDGNLGFVFPLHRLLFEAAKKGWAN